MRGAAARRLTAMLMVYPLLTTAAAFDVVWTVLLHDWRPPVVYTASVAVVAVTLALGTYLVRDLPRVAYALTLVVSLALSDAVLVMAALELARSGLPSQQLAVTAGGAALAALVFTGAVALGADKVARRLRRGPSRPRRVVLPVPPERRLPTLATLMSPTLVDDLESPTVVDRADGTTETREPAAIAS